MSDKRYTFVVVPKLTEDPFYQSAGTGCYEKGLELGNVDCHYIGDPEPDPQKQALIIRELVTTPSKYNLSKVDGITVAVLDEVITGEAIDFAVSAGIPVVTHDADSPNSKRQVFICTDNYAFGLALGKVLDQLYPEGTNYGIITGSGPNLLRRLDGVRDRLNDPLKPTKWKEISYSPLNCEHNFTRSIEQMYQYASDPDIHAIIPIGGWPMFLPNEWKRFIDANRHVITVVADTVDLQIKLMDQGYVNGLVGQMPYQMGEVSAVELLRINVENDTSVKGFVPTNILEMKRIPLDLPPQNINQNLLGNWKILGYTLFSVIVIFSATIAFWIVKNRQKNVVRAAQPEFMLMIVFGTMVLGSAILPLTIDDSGGHNTQRADAACMAFPYLISIGFTTAFAALFSKTWRIIQILRNATKFQRIRVQAKDVIKPFMALLVANVVTLICWTLLNPLKYVRQPHLGTDDWNRVISTYGSCQSVDQNRVGVWPYLIILGTFNGVTLLTANAMAYRARSVQTEYNESIYIAITMASILQALLIGLPIGILVYDQPVAYFIVITALIFAVCMAILCFIFIPKIFLHKKWQHERSLLSGKISGKLHGIGKLVRDMSLEERKYLFQFVKPETIVEQANLEGLDDINLDDCDENDAAGDRDTKESFEMNAKN